jgi:hypothetical protein
LFSRRFDCSESLGEVAERFGRRWGNHAPPACALRRSGSVRTLSRYT